MSILEKISHETMVFMRGKYRLDEIGNGKDELKFKQGQKTILTVYIKDDKYVFLIIFGKKEREVFDAKRDEYSQYIFDYYDNTRTYHDGKWMFIDVTTLEQLEEIKKLIIIKKKPNRKPFPKEGAYYSKCGHRCDLCLHFKEMNEEMREKMVYHVTNIWGESELWNMRCGGCYSPECYCNITPCESIKCASARGLSACKDCGEFPCPNSGIGDRAQKIHTNTYFADDITWGIMPYIPFQYEV